MADILDVLVAQAMSPAVEYSKALMSDMVRLGSFVVVSGMPESGIMVHPSVAPPDPLTDRDRVPFSESSVPPVPVVPVLEKSHDETIIREGHQEALHHQADVYHSGMKKKKSVAQKMERLNRGRGNRRLQMYQKTSGDMDDVHNDAL